MSLSIARAGAAEASSAAEPGSGSDSLVVSAASSLRGAPLIPGDKSISHRALMLALLARGRTTISGASDGEDVRSTRRIVEQLGASVAEQPLDNGTLARVVDSDGIGSLGPPTAALDCGNSGTSMRLFAGILAGQSIEAVLDGDTSLRRRPMARIVDPLRAMGADIELAGGGTPPLRIRGRSGLQAIHWTPDVASAQVKSAILLAGLQARGVTTVHERIPTRDHTERMLRARGVEVKTADLGNGVAISIEGGQSVGVVDTVVPGDASAATFWLVSGAAHPDADLVIRGVGVNPHRRGAIDILREMGAAIVESGGVREGATNDAVSDVGEPIADLRVRSSTLRAVDVDAGRVAAAIDEIPALALAATQARGTTIFRGAGELRVKESDRLEGIVDGLVAFGADVSVEGDDVRIVGPTTLHGARVDGFGDHRLVMTFAIAGLLASGQTSITGAAAAAISDPGFIAELERIRA